MVVSAVVLSLYVVFRSRHSGSMQVWLCLLFVLHVAEGCTLEDHQQRKEITAYTGGSVLLPCYCTDLNTKPETFRWQDLNNNTWKEIASESSRYRNRVQLFNDHSPGNLSLLISHLTEEDGRLYRCDGVTSGFTDISLTVKGCSLTDRGQTLPITAHRGGSVLLPCSCTELRAKPETLTWTRYNQNRKDWERIPIESDQYRNRVQLVNDHSPGNLSLLISHLTEEDGGVYMCDGVKSGYTYFRLTVEVCTLENREQLLNIKAHRGGSVLLPCSCTVLQTKPEEFIWRKYNRNIQRWEEISRQSGQYRNRVQLFNDHSPGNLSLLISHLTEEDGGGYECVVKGSHIYIRLTVKEPLPFVPFALVTVIFLHIVVGVVYCTRRSKDPRVHYSTGDGDDGVVRME